MNPGEIVPFRWDYMLIALSYVAASVGSLAALQCAAAIPQARGRVNWNALWAAAIALGGGGIWYMHFIGMYAGTFICAADSPSTGPTMGGSFFQHTVFMFGVLLLGSIGVFYTLGISDTTKTAETNSA